MINKILTSKVTSVASGECVVIALKLVDTEAHALRFFGLILFAVSILFLSLDWRHKAQAETVAAPVRTTRRTRKQPRSRTSRAHKGQPTSSACAIDQNDCDPGI